MTSLDQLLFGKKIVEEDDGRRMEVVSPTVSLCGAVTSSTTLPPMTSSSAHSLTPSIPDAANHIQLLLQSFQIANMQANVTSLGETGVARDPLGILSRGYKRKHSSIDSAVSSSMMTPVEGIGTPVDEGSPCFWSTGPGGGAFTVTSNNLSTTRRNKTFSAEMSDLFVHEVIRRKETLVENNTNREVDFNRQKKQAWHEVYEAVRMQFPAFTCTVEGMKTHWRYRKRRVRDAAPYMKKFREQGVGSEAIGDRMNDADWAIYDILTGNQKGEKEQGESDLEEKDTPTPPAKYCKMDDGVKSEENNTYPVSPASIVVSNDDSNSGMQGFSAAAASLLLAGVPPSSAQTMAPPPQNTSHSPLLLHPIPLRTEQAEEVEDRRLKRELIKQQTQFFTSMNCLVSEFRASLPILLTHFLSSTPLASPANSNSSSSSVDVPPQ